MVKRACHWFLLATLPCVLVLQAAEREVQVKLAGQQLSGGFSVVEASSVMAGSFQPAILSDGTEGVFVAWSVCVAASSPPICPHQVVGIAPRSAIARAPGGDAVELNFDTADLLVVFTSSTPSTWKGIIRRYDGVSSRSVKTTGQTEITDVFAGSADPNVMWALVQKTVGGREESTATFSGSIGWQLVVPWQMPNATLATHGGGVMVVRTTAP